MFLGIDVGQGTTDIFLWDPDQPLENSIQLVIPSASNRLAQEIDNEEGDIFCHGAIMGGIPLVKALKNKIRTGSRVYMTPESAMSIRYHLDFVTDLGISIVNSSQEVPIEVKKIRTTDFRFEWIFKFLQDALGCDPEINGVGIAVQDHGMHKKEEYARETRLQFYKEQLDQSPNLRSLGFKKSVPDRFPRLKAALKEKNRFFPAAEHYITDTSPIAILGALYDDEISYRFLNEAKTVINYGNGHTLVCVLDAKNNVVAFFEHHTGRIKDPKKFDNYLDELFEERLDSKAVLDDLGHGSYYLNAIPTSASENIIAIGPQRNLGKASKFQISFANPGGSMMMAGPIALVKAFVE
ncbi:MAG: DUF1786 family protein [Candidatus Hodarchaeales archaeon]|jgi:uncharacterized protein (DUF1786 family)